MQAKVIHTDLWKTCGKLYKNSSYNIKNKRWWEGGHYHRHLGLASLKKRRINPNKSFPHQQKNIPTPGEEVGITFEPGLMNVSRTRLYLSLPCPWLGVLQLPRLGQGTEDHPYHRQLLVFRSMFVEDRRKIQRLRSCPCL